MRTTVEIPDEQRARLLQLAAERGLKGFSELVQEALQRYLDETDQEQGKIDKALSALGSFSDEEAEEMRAAIERLRGRWRC